MIFRLFRFKKIASEIKPYLFRKFISSYDLSLSEADLFWALAYADLRRSGKFEYYIKLIARLILFLFNTPFEISNFKQLSYNENSNKKMILNRQHTRENFMYQHYVGDSSEFIFKKKNSKQKQRDYFLIFFLSLISDFYSVRKCHELAAIIKYFEENKVSTKFFGKKFYASDGANPHQRFVAIYLRNLRSLTVRVIAHNSFEIDKYFDEDIVIEDAQEQLVGNLNTFVKKSTNDIFVERLIVGNPGTFMIFGIQLKLMFLAFKFKLGGRNFSIKLHPQCPAWKELLLILFLGSKHVLPRKLDIHGAKIKLLIMDYDTSLRKFVFYKHCLRVQ